MKKEKPVCIVCGTEYGVRTHTLPHGSLSLCTSQHCFNKLCVKTEGSVPILWIGKEDFIEHEVLTKEEMKGQDDALIVAAQEAGEYMFTDSFWDDYGEGLHKGANEFERSIIRSTPKKELPLLLGHLKHGNDSYLARLIKGE